MSHYDTYSRVLENATSLGHHELVFWRSVVEAHQTERLDVEEIRGVIWQTSVMRSKPSRATTYRLLAQWHATIDDLDNNGRGA